MNLEDISSAVASEYGLDKEKATAVVDRVIDLLALTVVNRAAAAQPIAAKQPDPPTAVDPPKDPPVDQNPADPPVNQKPADPPPTQEPAAGSAPHVLRLDCFDGRSMTLSEADATDVGDIIDGPVHQRCLRLISPDKLWMVDFRPEADGSRHEIVVEFGSLYEFSPDAAPKTASGVTPHTLGVPPAIVVTKTTGGSNPAQNVYIGVSYAFPEGEGLVAGFISGAMPFKAGEIPIVASPEPMPGAIGYYPYAIVWGANPNNPYIRQTTDPIPFGQNWTAPLSGLLTKGQEAPSTPARPAYVANISGGTLAAPVVITVPWQEWGTRWRWQSAPRPIVRTYEDLVAMKAIPRLSLEYRGGAAIPPGRDWLGPTDTGGLYVAMGATGDRNDVGLITEQQAAYLLTGDDGCRRTMMAQAEAVGSMPLWIRDVATGATVDAGAYPYIALSDASSGGKRYAIPTPAIRPISPNRFGLDTAHMPAAAFVVGMLTRDPYLLEAMHATAMFGVLQFNRGRLQNKLPRLVNTGQPRSLAWNWRDMFRNMLFTPNPVPSWLLSQDQWRAYIPDQVEFGNRYIGASVSPCTTVFKFFPAVSNNQAFMLDYILLTAGWIKLTGEFPEMDPIIAYAATPRLTMSDPTDKAGWDHRHQMIYYGPVFDARKGAQAIGSPAYDYRVPASPDTPESWAELWSCMQKWAAVHESGWVAPEKLAPDTLSPVQRGYLSLIRADLAGLAQAGVPGAREAHDWLASKLFATKTVQAARFKWAISPDP